MSQRKSLAWRLFVSSWVVYSAFWTPYLIREHFPAMAIAELGSLNVDRYQKWCEDIFPGPRGGAYINNNPGASLAGAIPLLAIRPLMTSLDNLGGKLPVKSDSFPDVMFQAAVEEGRGITFLVVAFATVVGLMAPVTALTVAYLGVRILQAGVPAAWAAGVALLYGIGTPVLFRTGYLNHNLLVGNAGFIGLLVLWRPSAGSITRRRALVAGLLSGYAVLCDFSGLVVLAMLGLYIGWRGWREPGESCWMLMAWYSVGALPGLLGLLVYQEIAFGSFFLPSQHYMTPTWPTAHGYKGIDWPSPGLIWANFFDPRFGLFAYCPLLLLAILAPFVRAVKYRVPATETAFILALFGLFVLFCAANGYSWLQWNTGFRYLVPVVPGLLLLSAQVLQAAPRLLRSVAVLFTLLHSLAITVRRPSEVGSVLKDALTEGVWLPWMKRLAEMGLFSPWQGWSVILLVTVAVVLCSLWLPWLRRPGTTMS